MEVTPKIRILLVDDSSTVRMILRDLLSAMPGLDIAGEAANGREAVEKTFQLNPDILVMDVEMPVLNGFEATEEIMAHRPKPILILSSIINRSEVYTSMRAIALGALDVMQKPEFTSQDEIRKFSNELADKIRMLARIRVIPHIRGRHSLHQKIQPAAAVPPSEGYQIVGIGCSTGGPLALKVLLSALDPSFPLPIVIVQHITNGFLEGLADWLQAECKRRIEVAKSYLLMEPGVTYMIPNGSQPLFPSRQVLQLDERMPDDGGFKPSANTLLHQVALTYGPAALGVLLTGMGGDGAKGLLDIKKAGGITIAQDQSTSIVYGMPKVAVDLGAAFHILPIGDIAPLLQSLVSGKTSL